MDISASDGKGAGASGSGGGGSGGGGMDVFSLPDAKTNPFQKQLDEASQRLRNAQIAMMRSKGPREKMELQIAQQAFQTAHTLAIQFDNPTLFPRAGRRDVSGNASDGSSTRSVSSASESRRERAQAQHPYNNPSSLDRRARNKRAASKYRQKKKMYVQELERKCQQLNDTVGTLKTAVTKLQAENKLLKEQMSFLKQLVQTRNGGPPSSTHQTVAPRPVPAVPAGILSPITTPGRDVDSMPQLGSSPPLMDFTAEVSPHSLPNWEQPTSTDMDLGF